MLGGSDVKILTGKPRRVTLGREDNIRIALKEIGMNVRIQIESH